ncbi:serine/threonine-protein kinase [Lentzea flava]|uniref:non-specific serine/threonine protein kinase n=1 Tax=Lentzea flava TaxID=103732 RepID=A0ABQ2VE88_9PSEU|nr:serine/threonine-protein kinase [Lentzea flava]MCP2204973.1 Serine/threonine protein kinase [Lentzea flava]GGU82592.1 serine/threonine protein kinase [Lentzea flava]
MEDQERLIAARYRLLHMLGQGSMGTVWAAHDEVLRRQVAVKGILRPPGMPDAAADELRERTMREARAVAALSHPNLVTLYDVVQHDGDPYVVMELVPSRSLGEVLQEQGCLTEKQGAAVLDAVAAALASAHRAGITHRDVKPGNVLIADDGRIKLTDFGIARNVAEATMTARGITLGTPAYIAPEVAQGGDVSEAADRWSLGATMWAAMAGEPPYVGKNVMQTINAVINGDVPVPAGAGRLAPVISGLMRKDPAERLSLVDVRKQVYPLLPEPGTDAFEVESVPLPIVVRPKPKIEPDAPLADDPGPLPFMITKPIAPPRERGRVATTFLLVAAILLFVAGSGGGFALTRLAAGAPLLPPTEQTVQTLPTLPTAPTLQPRTASAVTAIGDQGGKFTLNVEASWAMYAEQRAADKLLPPSAVVHFVSDSGAYEVAVQRFPDFYPARRISTYTAAVQARWPGRFFGGEKVPTANLAGPRSEDSIQFVYKTVEGEESNALRRSHFSRVLPYGNDLWVVEVVVPTEQEDEARARLFDAIASTFAPV